MSRSELRQQLDDVIRQATAMRVVLEEGGLPMLADARILRGQGQCAEKLVELEYIKELRALPERTPEQDRAAQHYVVGIDHARRERGAA